MVSGFTIETVTDEFLGIYSRVKPGVANEGLYFFIYEPCIILWWQRVE